MQRIAVRLTSMAGEIEFSLEFASTYSYPAAARIEPEATKAGVTVAWRPFLLGPIFAAQGWTDSPFNLYPAKGAYMWRDLERTCAEAGIPWKRPSAFPRGSLVGSRLAAIARGESWVADFIRAVYHANFAQDRAIDRDEVIVELLIDLGRNAQADLERAKSDTAKLTLRDATTEAGQRGVFGAPSFFSGAELFWGNDRLEAALAQAQR
ncbi:MAG: 2-hydroxychromene-2-carboxylate isomerase [Hyphomicrobiaceae bacterium]|jgi:2-hydroxychromene-2-carboxylate isomerase